MQNKNNPQRNRRRPLSYKKSLAWILNNDDISYLDKNEKDPEGYLSVTAAAVADIYGVDDEKIRKDLIKMKSDISAGKFDCYGNKLDVE